MTDQKHLVCTPEEVKVGLELLPKNCENWTADEFQKALNRAPANTYLLCRLAQSQYYEGALDDALANFQKLRPQVPNCRTVIHHMGLIHFRKCHLSEAEKCFEQIIEIDNEFAMAYYWLGLTNHHMRKYGSALRAYKQHIEKAPESHIALFNIAMIYLEMNQYEDVVRTLEELITETHEDPAAYLQLGLAYSHLDRLDEAMSCIKKVLNLNPSDKRAQHMVRVLEERIRSAEAPI